MAVMMSLRYHLRTLWLFTCSDMKSLLVPSIAFGVFGALSGSLFGFDAPQIAHLRIRLLHATFWLWPNLLSFCLSSQRTQESVEEDTLTKPWRPIPAGRISPERAERLMWAMFVFNYIVSAALGGHHQYLAFTFLTIVHNDLGGANFCVSRNVLIAGGFTCSASATFEILAQNTLRTSTYSRWIVILCATIATTIQLRDLKDQKRDRRSGRQTLPILLGDSTCRMTIVIFVVFWSAYCPLFWGLQLRGRILTYFLGIAITYRLLFQRTGNGDSYTFTFWGAWLLSLYALPLFKVMERGVDRYGSD